MLCLVTQSCPALYNAMHCNPPGFSVHGNSPGNSTGVDCHVLLQGIFPTQGSNPDLPHRRQTVYRLSHQGSPRLLCPWDFPGTSTGVDCHFLLQGIFPTQGWNPGLPHYRQTLYRLSHLLYTRQKNKLFIFSQSW